MSRISPGVIGSCAFVMMVLSSVVVGNFDVVRAPVGPDEADSVLDVDPDRVLTHSIPGQLLEMVPRWDPQAVPEPLSLGILQGPYYEVILTCQDSITQSK